MDGERHLVARFMAQHRPLEVERPVHFLLSNGRDHVARLQIGAGGGTVFFDRADDQARLIAHGFLGHDAVPVIVQPFDRHQPCGRAHRLVDRDGEADALGAGPHGHVHADHLAIDVNQRAAGIARIDLASV